jgi:5-methylcytosine-specific restriction endonuclease McrA
MANTSGSKWIRKERRLALYMRDSFTCTYCARDLHNAPKQAVTLDHVVCRAHNGGNENTNLVTACVTCNSTRGNKLLHEFATIAQIARVLHNIAQPLNMPLARALTTAKKRAA